MALPALLLAIELSLLAQPERNGVISGTVVDEATGDPVRKAIVTLTWHGEPESYATAMTDRSGEFTFDSLPPGSYSLHAEAYEIQSRASDFISLVEGEGRTGVQLILARPGSISGTVYDPEGEPLAGATVVAVLPGDEGQPLTTQTGIAGEYRFEPLRPGRYYVGVPAECRRTSSIPESTQHPSQMFGTVYFGGASARKDARPVVVRAGAQTSGIDIRLAKTKAITITGRFHGTARGSDAGQQPRNV